MILRSLKRFRKAIKSVTSIGILRLNVARELKSECTFCIYVYDVVVNKSTFAISSPDEFLVLVYIRVQGAESNNKVCATSTLAILGKILYRLDSKKEILVMFPSTIVIRTSLKSIHSTQKVTHVRRTRTNMFCKFT